jgi:hypothetical protein
MENRCTWRRRWRIVAMGAALSITTGAGLCQLEPVGKKAALLQFDVASELKLDEGPTHSAVFARYWVCADYYAISVVWDEPSWPSVHDMKAMTVLSDAAGFRVGDRRFPGWTSANTTYSKPLGERGPFEHGGGLYDAPEMRFAEAEALSRRVYSNDLTSGKDTKPGAAGIIDVNVAQGPGRPPRKLARLKAQARDDRIEWLELSDARQQQLAKMRYEYGQEANGPRLTKMIADLPVRSVKLPVDVNTPIVTKLGSAEGRNYTATEVDHAYHTGGRTCTVTYQDVTLKGKVLRLPALVEVRRTDNQRLVHRARLTNFRHVDLDKAGVWEAAQAFAGADKEWLESRRLEYRFVLSPALPPKPLKIDPNDLDFVRKLVAKYPLPQGTPPTRGPDGRYQSPARQTPPPRMEIEPNDIKMIRQLIEHYMKLLRPPLTEQQKADRERGGVTVKRSSLPERLQEISRLRVKLRLILGYHSLRREEKLKLREPTDADIRLVRRLQAHYEPLAAPQDAELGGRLKALFYLTRFDLILKDYEAFEGHAHRALQILKDARLSGAYMASGHDLIKSLVEAGQYERATKLLRRWAQVAGADNEADGVLLFTSSSFGSQSDPWASLQLLDRLLWRTDLSAGERYEALAARAIVLNALDKLLTGPVDAMEDESHRAQARWILGSTSKAAVAQMLEPALRQALSAWQALGPARLTEAKPYSTAGLTPVSPTLQWGPEATRLQETSARLDQIVRQRLSQGNAPPRPSDAAPRRTKR